MAIDQGRVLLSNHGVLVYHDTCISWYIMVIDNGVVLFGKHGASYYTMAHHGK